MCIGLNDVNQVRVQTSRAYLRKCDAVWVVTDIGRVKNDSSTFKLLTQMLERLGHMDSDNVALICTHSEVRKLETLLAPLMVGRTTSTRANSSQI